MLIKNVKTPAIKPIPSTVVYQWPDYDQFKKWALPQLSVDF